VPMLEGRVEHVIGVDTHRDSHAAAVLDPTGGPVAQVEIPSSQQGYEQLLHFAAERASGRRCWALEGTGCYGAGLASFLTGRGEWVAEIDRPKRTGRTQAKSDALDAIRAGREALSRDQLACPRQRGQREALRLLQLTRAGAVKVGADASGGVLGHRAALRATAERALAAHAEATQLGKELGTLARVVAPALLAQPGVGPVTAAQVLISWSHPGRLRSEAAFAMLAGAAPIEASSGRVVRHRLNRGGDRQLNRALHTIVMLRERYHQPTRRDVARRTAEGKASARSAAGCSVASPGSCTGCWSGRPCPPPVQEGSDRRRCRHSMAEPAERPDATTDTPGAGERPEAAWVGGGRRGGCRPGPHRSPAGEPSPPARRRPADPDQPGVPDQLPAGRRPGGVSHPLPWAAAHLAAG
jgi:transposase